MAQTDTQRSVTATGQTGTTCATTGPYKCNTHSTVVVFFSKGDKFSNCPTSSTGGSSATGHATTWSTVNTQ
jgi:hypothetical protein